MLNVLPMSPSSPPHWPLPGRPFPLPYTFWDWLLFLFQQNTFEFHPSCCMGWFFLLLSHIPNNSPSMNAPVYPFTQWRTSGCFQFLATTKSPMRTSLSLSLLCPCESGSGWGLSIFSCSLEPQIWWGFCSWKVQALYVGAGAWEDTGAHELLGQTVPGILGLSQPSPVCALQARFLLLTCIYANPDLWVHLPGERAAQLSLLIWKVLAWFHQGALRITVANSGSLYYEQSGEAL